MTDIDIKTQHDDPALQRLFDLEHAAHRAGVPTLDDPSYTYQYGLARAGQRAEQRKPPDIPTDADRLDAIVKRELAANNIPVPAPLDPHADISDVVREDYRLHTIAVAVADAARDEQIS